MQNKKKMFAPISLQCIDQGRPIRSLYRGGFHQLVSKCVLTQLISHFCSLFLSYISRLANFYETFSR